MSAQITTRERMGDALAYAAEQVARHFDFLAPARWLADIGIELRVRPDVLQLPGRRVRGAWDPVLRRLELFGVQPEATDDMLMHTFAHELYHVLRGRDERDAERFSVLFMARVSATDLATGAAALRALCPPADPHQN
jgi:hypothetical protein